MDLVQFLRDRLDEEATLAGSGETWTAFDEAPDTGTRRVDVDHSFERVTACTRSWRALHIARHDPARVLADVEAKRRIVEEANLYLCDSGPGCGYRTKHGHNVLRLLALPYADHPDYREEWRP